MQGLGREGIHFLGTDHETGVHHIIQEPLHGQFEAGDELGTVADEGEGRRAESQQGGQMAGRGVEDRFRKQDRAGGGGIAEDLAEETATVVHAAIEQGEDDPGAAGFIVAVA